MNPSQKSVRWRLLLTPPRDGAENMARDMALMDRTRETGECVFSVYTWSRPTLSLGRNQTALGSYDQKLIEAENLDVVRRPTGGRAILHDHEVTYSVTGPDSWSPHLADAYNRINAILLQGLRAMGAPVEIARPTTIAPVPNAIPCFHEPVVGELVAAGRKLVGSAQFREKGAFLQHGSILMRNDQNRLAALLVNPADSWEVSLEPATLSDFLPDPPRSEAIAAQLFAAVRNLENEEAKTLSESEIRPSALALRPRFEDLQWTWRR